MSDEGAAAAPSSGDGRGALRRGAPLLLALALPLLVSWFVVASDPGRRHYLQGDGAYYFLTAGSLWLDHDLDLGNQLPPPLARHDQDVALDRRGRLVPKHPLVLPLLALPLLVALGPLGALVFNLLQLVALLAVTYRLAHRCAPPWAAALGVALTGAASFIPYYAWNFSPDLLGALLLLGGWLALLGDGAGRPRLVVAGLLLGLALVARPSLAVLLPAIVLLGWGRWRRMLLPVAAGLLPPLAAAALLGLHLFGSPFATGYDHMAVFGPDGIHDRSVREDFGQPIADGLRWQAVDREHGLLPTSPITVVALLALPLLARRQPRLAAAIGFTAVALVLLLARFEWGAFGYGNRLLMPVVALGALPIAALLATLGERWQAVRQRAAAAAA